MLLPILWSITGSVAVYKSIKYLLSDDDSPGTSRATYDEAAQAAAALAVARAKLEQAERLAAQQRAVEQQAITHALHSLCDDFALPHGDLALLRQAIHPQHPLVNRLKAQQETEQQANQQRLTTLTQALTALEQMCPTTADDKELPHA